MRRLLPGLARIALFSRLEARPADLVRASRIGTLSPFATLIAGALVTPLLASCGGSGNSGSIVPVVSEPPPVTRRPADGGSGMLKSFTGPTACTQLEAYIEDSVLASVSEPILALRQRLANPAAAASTGRPTVSLGLTVATTARPAAAAPAAASDQTTYGPRRHSAPRPDIDEGDFVVDDGARFWTLGPDTGTTEIRLARVDRLAGGRLVEGPNRRWGTRFTTLSAENTWALHRLDNGRLAAVTTGAIRPDTFGGAGSDAIEPALRLATSPPMRSAARVRLVDTTSTNLDITWQGDIAGALLSSRRIGSQLHLVTQALIEVPTAVVDASSLRYEVEFERDVALAIARIDRQITANEATVRAVTLAQWLAPIDGLTAPTPEHCAGFFRVDAPTWPGFLRISTLDTSTGLSTHRTVLARADAVHQAGRAMILASPAWASGVEASTHLHRFTLGDRDTLGYDGSTRIDGRLIAATAIDETDSATLRVAAREEATSGEAWTYLATYEPATAPLPWRLLGRTDPIRTAAPVHSVDFLGDQAYLAIDDKADPLLVYDLSQASQPIRLGVVELPGNASWLSRIGPGLLLGFADAGVAPWQPQLEVTLFDITDPALPVVRSTLRLDAYMTSPAFADPRDATWSATADGGEGLLALTAHPSSLPPLLGSGPYGIDLVSVRPELGAAALSRIGLLDTLGIDVQTGEHPLRTFLLGDHVYVVSPLGLRSAAVAAPDQVISTIRFQPF